VLDSWPRAPACPSVAACPSADAVTHERALELCAEDTRRASDRREFERLAKKLGFLVVPELRITGLPATTHERNLLIDLAGWSEDFFDTPDGAWGQDAAAALRKLTNTNKGEPSPEAS
jgi:hypothetical protein